MGAWGTGVFDDDVAVPRTHRITRLTKSHPDWLDADFRHLGTVAVPRRKRGSRVWGELTWPGLARFYGN